MQRVGWGDDANPPLLPGWHADLATVQELAVDGLLVLEVAAATSWSACAHCIFHNTDGSHLRRRVRGRAGSEFAWQAARAGDAKSSLSDAIHGKQQAGDGDLGKFELRQCGRDINRFAFRPMGQRVHVGWGVLLRTDEQTCVGGGAARLRVIEAT